MTVTASVHPPLALRTRAPRYDMIDAWRGIAALSVVIAHTSVPALGIPAVVMFFVISGYCITVSAESSVRKGTGFLPFMMRRVRRIYPPYLFAIAFFLLTRFLRARMGGAEFHRPLIEWIQNLTLTQWLSLVAHPTQLAGDNPANFVAAFWSLGYEEQFYLVSGILIAVGAMAHRWTLALVLGVVGVAWELFVSRLCHGFFVEYWPIFAIGILVYRRQCLPLTRATATAIDVGLVLVALLCGWARAAGYDAPTDRPIFLEWTVAATFAVILIALRPFDAQFGRSLLGRILMPLGLISYSLYLVHQFNLHLAGSVAARILGATAPLWLNTATQLVVQIAVATVFWFMCERPFLSRRRIVDAIAPGSPQASHRDPVPIDPTRGAVELP